MMGSTAYNALSARRARALARRTQPTRRTRRHGNPMFWVILSVIAALLLVALVGPMIAPASVNTSSILDAFSAPSSAHWLGTDAQGRDVFWRLVVGARYSIFSAVLVVAGYSVIGVLVAVAAATGGRVVDQVLMRVCDAGLALPPLVFAMGLAAVLGGGLGPAIVALIATGWPFTARLLREVLRETSQSPFIEGARVLGLSKTRVMMRHILPNSLDVLIVKWAADIGFVILSLSALSFIGVGAQPPIPEWGALVNEAARSTAQGWWVIFAPGIAIALTVTAFALLGDQLQARLNPLLRTSVTAPTVNERPAS
ncbi:ABC transporter permease [Herbiconiux daphne]|uniref:ABC transporter permease n=1 Tax=Herbiconiux daphne TaxID=2970914 RepID=A0ABT2H6H5_9MICO|nr:ABC transporter permease [Herbiconiux daphne]MCS5735556.1 ABC transporter permease [Herbiconiux daphne]